jgi:lipoprotein-releasing system permease protein
MSFPKMLSDRYLRGRRGVRSTYVLIAGGIALGLFALLTVSSVMNGFDRYMTQIVTDSKGHIWITGREGKVIAPDSALLSRIRQVKGVEGAAPVCRADLVVRKGDRLSTVVAWGIDPESFRTVTRVFNHVVVNDPSDTGMNGVMIGIDQSVHLGASAGDSLQLLTPVGLTPTPFGLLPNIRAERVVGIIQSGMPDYDQLYLYMPLRDGQFFTGDSTHVDLIMVRTTDPGTSYRVASRLRRELGADYQIENWSEFDANLFFAMKVEKTVMFFVLSLVFVIVAFNLAGNFIRLAVEKKQEIGILKAVGLTRADTASVFLRAGAIISGWGTFVGLLSAGLAIAAQLRWHILRIPVPGFPFSVLPVVVRPMDFLFAAVIAMSISLGACWIAVRRVTAMDPGTAIRDGR